VNAFYAIAVAAQQNNPG